jgi:hypothetical protein
MKPILILILIGIIGYASGNKVSVPPSSEASSGKSVYVPPPQSIDVAEEGCVQKEDQNVTGYGGAKWQ